LKDLSYIFNWSAIKVFKSFQELLFKMTFFVNRQSSFKNDLILGVIGIVDESAPLPPVTRVVPATPSPVPVTEPVTLQVDDEVRSASVGPQLSPVPPGAAPRSPQYLGVEEVGGGRQGRFSVVTHPGDAAEDHLWEDGDPDDFSEDEDDAYGRPPRSRHEKVKCRQ
jgi:hypothetical protein